MNMDDKGIQLGQVFEQSRKNSEDIAGLRSDISGLRQSIDNLGSALSRAGRTDWTALGTWAAVIVAFIIGIGTPVIVGIVSELHGSEARQAESTRELDAKLQRELSLALKTIEQSADNVNTASKERHSSVMEYAKSQQTRIDRLENLRDDDIKADMSELRMWRSRGLYTRPTSP